MNSEIKRLMEIKEKQVHNKHNRLNDKDLKRLCNALFERGDTLLRVFEEHSSKEIIQLMEECLYITLSYLGRMHLFFDYYLDLVLEKKCGVGKVDGKYTKSQIGYYQKVKEELVEQKHCHYSGINANYAKMMKYCQELNLPVNKPELLATNDSRKASSFYNEFGAIIVQNATNLLNSDDVVEDIDYFLNLIFAYFRFFAAIGYNPTNDINCMINEESSNKGRNYQKTPTN